MRTFVVAIVLLALFAGCQATPESMVGRSMAEVEARFGAIEDKSPSTVPQEPSRRHPCMTLSLEAGDPYLFAFYPDLDGLKWYLTFVSPGLFEKRRGWNPGSAEWYLIEAHGYDKDLVW